MNRNARTAPPTRPANKTKDAIIGLITLAVLTCIGVIAYPMLGTGAADEGTLTPSRFESPAPLLQ